MNYSKQREAITDFLNTRKDHPTAEVIYQNVRGVIPNISLGTVYRNLRLLADNGMIRRVRGMNDIEHFDADISDHQHFICRNCGSVQDVMFRDRQLVTRLNSDIQGCFEGRIESNDIYFFGLCGDCCKKN